MSAERVETFCDMIIERGYDLNIWVYGRVDTIKESLLAKLKQAGVHWIALGIESGNERVRRGVNKKIHKNIDEVVKLIKRFDINIIGNYMFGLPEDNLETMGETLRLAIDLNCEFINFYTVMAYPGSTLYNSVKDSAPHVLPPTWDGYSQHSYETQPLPTSYLSAAEVLRFRDEAFLEYFRNENYLRYMEEKFGTGVKTHLEKMLNIKLSRMLLE